MNIKTNNLGFFNTAFIYILIGHFLGIFISEELNENLYNKVYNFLAIDYYRVTIFIYFFLMFSPLFIKIKKELHLLFSSIMMGITFSIIAVNDMGEGIHILTTLYTLMIFITGVCRIFLYNNKK